MGGRIVGWSVLKSRRWSGFGLVVGAEYACGQIDFKIGKPASVSVWRSLRNEERKTDWYSANVQRNLSQS